MDIIKKALFAVFISPVVIWLVLHPKIIINEWVKIPGYFRTNLTSVFSEDKISKVNIIRWNSFGPANEDWASKIYYNKGFAAVDGFFSFLSYLSPRLYFQAGDGTGFSPHGVEPVAAPAFVFWVAGIIYLIKKKEFLLIYLSVAFGAVAYIFGQRNFAFLFPVLLTYLAIFLKGLESIRDKNRRSLVYIGFILYGLFLIARVVYKNV